jgi:hypothetical protein
MKIEDFIPSTGRVIVKKTRELTKVVEVEVPDYENAIVADPEPQGEFDLEDGKRPPVVPKKLVKEKATRGIQIGELVAIHPEDADKYKYHIGDKVVYGIHTLKEFDLVKGKFGLLDTYNVLGVIREQ